MARSLSSQKRTRQNVKRAARNKARRSSIKSAVRKFNDAVASKDAKVAGDAFAEATRIMDRSSLRRAIHRNTAARRKSRLAKRLNAIKAGK